MNSERLLQSGHATPEQWNEYWSAYTTNSARQREEEERPETVRAEVTEERTTPRPDLSGAAGATGISLGSALAVVLSFQLNHSILWAVLHGMLSWFYVLYRAWQGNY